MRLLLSLFVISLLFVSLYFELFFVKPFGSKQEELLLFSFILVLAAALGLLIAVYLSTTVPAQQGQRLVLVAIWLMVSVQVILVAGNLIALPDNMVTANKIINMNDARVVEVGSDGLLIEGYIGPNTLDSFISRNLSTVRYLELNSIGGLIDPAIQIGRLVDDYKIITIVQGECSSACVLIAIKGKFLLASASSQFGFHQGSSLSDRESSHNRFISQQATDTLVQELKESGIPESILTSVRNTPSDQMTVFSGMELQEAGVVDRVVNFR